ncbi:hypothetical protein DFO67_108128 [Modicisalibacter xianhensis]|uniref:Uncharacterized protein n=1 Tax=Modicisalibacter xianhensis TaxID=442341 RepID=A0A4R8FRT7_9GAMM|nr:hypothetical protein [Halomonas xianhensis]TDX29084.1 hypothetical protein DFO67_108128 [Halomonas xianhensis]
MSRYRNPQDIVSIRKHHSGYWKRREGRVTLSSEQTADLRLLCYHTKWLAHRWQTELGPALQALGSRHATECHEHIIAAAKLAACVSSATRF